MPSSRWPWPRSAGEAFDCLAGAVNFSFGLEWRTAEAEYIPDEYLRSGDVVGFNPGLPTVGRHHGERDLRRGARPDPGGSAVRPEPQPPTAVPQLGLRPRWRRPSRRPTCTASTGASMNRSRSAAQFQRAIRAPNIGDLYGGLQLNFPTLIDPCSSRNTANRTPAVRALCDATGVPAASVFTAGVQPDNIIPVRSGGNPICRKRARTRPRWCRVHADRSSMTCRDHRLLRHQARRRHCAARRRCAEHAEPVLPHGAGRQQRLLPGRSSQSGLRARSPCRTRSTCCRRISARIADVGPRPERARMDGMRASAWKAAAASTSARSGPAPTKFTMTPDAGHAGEQEPLRRRIRFDLR